MTREQSRDANQSVERTPLHILAPEIAERIAAGEVIERPASVVKELLENALDAGARELRIEIRGGGLQLIRVSDDGNGVLEDDLLCLCVRHTTSKIAAYEDLWQLKTLGFRGEALASIATVADVTILSRAIETESAAEEQPAQWVMWRGGALIESGRRARVHGTTVSVRDLFFNVPARLSFMRGARTENGHIVQLVRRYALGYPHVRFSLTIDEHSALQVSGSGEVATTLTELYHLSLNELLDEIETGEQEHYRLHGYVGNRVLAQNNRQYITVFVNGRWVASRVLQDALEQGYRSLLPKGKHPVLVLYVDVPPQEVDVNVHPAKSEVQLAFESSIVTALSEVIKTVLQRSPVLPEAVQFPGPSLVNQRRLPGPRRRGLHISESAEGYRAEVAIPGSREVIASLQPLAQLQQAVILAEAPDGSLYLVDQHRAHERVIYEHLRKTYTSGEQDEVGIAHLLLEPVIIEMKRYEAELLEQRLPMLRGLGIECERFGGRSFLVRAIPVGENGAGQQQLVEHLQELAEIAAEDSNDWQDHLLIGLACRSALRRGRELGSGEQRHYSKHSQK